MTQNLSFGKWVLVHVGFAMTIIDEEEAKQTQEALIAMSQLEHEVGDFLASIKNKQDCVCKGSNYA